MRLKVHSELSAAERLLIDLIRFDTSNPPGGEGPCARYVAGLLRDWGAEVQLLECAPDRCNVLARIPGRGVAPGLLLQGHLDVVPAFAEEWSRMPFGGEVADGCVWGRGALDMKGGLAMMLGAVRRMLAASEIPPGDILLALVADEEDRGELGARFLVEQHPELFRGTAYAIGEDGGAPRELGSRRIQPVVVAEKRACRVRATVRGTTRHAAYPPASDGTLTMLTALLDALCRQRLPARLLPVVEATLATVRSLVPAGLADRLALVADRPDDVDELAAVLPDTMASHLSAAVRNTATPTIIRAGQKINVQPGEATVDIDGRLLPGVDTDAFLDELVTLLPAGVELSVIEQGPVMPEPRLDGFCELLQQVVREKDAEAEPLPMLTTASTDARFFAQLGIGCYGYLPMRLPSEYPVASLLHGIDERLPLGAVALGEDCLYEVLTRYR